jgi:hypothetical protein
MANADMAIMQEFKKVGFSEGFLSWFIHEEPP